MNRLTLLERPVTVPTRGMFTIYPTDFGTYIVVDNAHSDIVYDTITLADARRWVAEATAEESYTEQPGFAESGRPF